MGIHPSTIGAITFNRDAYRDRHYGADGLPNGVSCIRKLNPQVWAKFALPPDDGDQSIISYVRKRIVYARVRIVALRRFVVCTVWVYRVRDHHLTSVI